MNHVYYNAFENDYKFLIMLSGFKFIQKEILLKLSKNYVLKSKTYVWK